MQLWKQISQLEHRLGFAGRLIEKVNHFLYFYWVKQWVITQLTQHNPTSPPFLNKSQFWQLT